MGARTAHAKTEQPRIYVACLAAYTNGTLHGAWVEAARDPWELWDDIQAMLRASPVAGAEEYAIHDYEGFGGVRIAESESLDRVAAVAAFLVEHGALGAALLDHCDNEVDEARAVMAERYLGAHASLADYVRELTEDCMTIPEPLRAYVDWDSMARDTELSGDLIAIAGAGDAVHVFTGR